MQVFRVPAHECVAPESQRPTLSRLATEWPSSGESSSPPALSTFLLVWGPAVANRLLLATLEALEHGWLSGQQWLLEIEEPLGIAPDALRTILGLVDAVASVWGAPGIAPNQVRLRTGSKSFLIERSACGQYEMTFTPTGTAEPPDVRLVIEPFHGPLHRLPDRSKIPQVVVRSTLLPIDLLQARPAGALRRVVAEPEAIPSEALRRILQSVFGKREFQPDGPEPRGQEIAIRRILAGRDAIVLLPTGAGKSLIYQFAGLLLPGTTIVVDPIVSLIEDQLYGLSQLGIDRAIGLSSHDSRVGSHDAKLDRVLSGDALFVFVAPERLQQRVFQQALRALSASSPINLAVVDEAHCVSEWGHDFRTSYLSLGQTLRETAKDDTGSAPPIIALTGTASRPVLADVLNALDIDRSDPDAVITPRDFDRPELKFAVVEADDSEILSRLTGVLRGLPTRFTTLHVPRDPTEFLAPRGADTAAGIIFCQTVNAPRRGAAAIAEGLTRSLGFTVPLYSGTAPHGAKDHERTKRRAAAAFKRNRIPLLVATKAYGMGIDKPNVRFIVHVGTSSSIESYYQEAGRSGRDRREAHCIILRTPGDAKVHDYFDGRTFRGVDTEVAAVEQVLQLLETIGERREVQIPMGGSDEQRERALHRLRVLGVVDRYLVNFGAKKYECTLSDLSLAEVDRRLVLAIRGVQPARSSAIATEVGRLPPEALGERVLRHARTLIEFIYDTIVASRRRATEEMLRLADPTFDGEEIRRRILAYMDIGDVGRDLTELLERDVFLYSDWLQLLAQMTTADDARDWRGATARLLESDPNHPGLLLGRALAEVLADVGDPDVFAPGVVASFREARTHYDTPVEEAESAAISILDWTRDRHPSWTGMLYEQLDEIFGDASTDVLADYEYQCLRMDSIDHSEAAAIAKRRLRRSRRAITTLASTLCDLPV
jgi:ATP-dependent DNA helicase RecQ